MAANLLSEFLGELLVAIHDWPYLCSLNRYRSGDSKGYRLKDSLSVL